MKIQRNLLRVFTVSLFLFGILLALALGIGTAWPDLEASLFDRSLTAEESLPSMRCPLLLTTADTADISISVSNPLSRPVALTIRGRVSQGYATFIREEAYRVELEVGEEEELSWPVDATDAAFGSVILARINIPRAPGIPSRTGSCGILVVPISGIGGTPLLWLSILLSLSGIGIGAALWLRQERPLRGRQAALSRAFGVLTIMVLINMIAGMLGWWLASVLFTTLIAIFLGALLERFLVSHD